MPNSSTPADGNTAATAAPPTTKLESTPTSTDPLQNPIAKNTANCTAAAPPVKSLSEKDKDKDSRISGSGSVVVKPPKEGTGRDRQTDPTAIATKQKVPFGGFSFESESLPDFSEFENTSADSQDGQGTKGGGGGDGGESKRPSDGQMAPTTTIETVTISRPLKVIAFICGLFACLLLVMALASSEWLIEPGGYRQGLFVYCLPKLMSNVTVPFVDPRNPELMSEGCHRIDLGQQAYTLVAAAFVVVSLLVNVFATLLTVLGLRCRDPNNKYKYYRIAVYVMAVALVAILVALVVYPVCFANIMERSGRQYWEFGWAYGVAWGAAIFLFGGVILLLCDKESEEIYYKERTIVQYPENNKA